MSRMRNALTGLIVAILGLAWLASAHVPGAVAVPAAPTTTSGATVQGQAVSAGDTIPVLGLGESGLRMSNVSVSSASTFCLSGNHRCTASVEATGTLTVGADATPLDVAIDYESDDDWTVTITAGSAGSAYLPPRGAPIDLNQVSGTIAMTSGAVTSDLTVSGVTYNGLSLSGTAEISAAGITATVSLSSVPAASGGATGGLVVTLSNSAPPSLALQLGGAGSTTLIPVTIDFTDSANWTASIPDGTDLPTATYPATISGSITKSNGVTSASLDVTAQIGDSSLDLSATLAPGAITATATATNLTLTTLTGQAASGGSTSSSIVLTTGTVTVSTQARNASMSGTFDIGGATVTTSGSYASATDWSISIAANSATDSGQTIGYRGASVDALSGTVTMTGGGLTTSLAVSGVTVGDATMDMTATISNQGIEASATVQDLTVSGFELETATITVSTISPAAAITASLVTDAGTFDVDMSVAQATGTGCSNWSCYDLTISATGADLAAGSEDFYLQAFGFTWSSTVPASGCSTIDVSVSGTAVMGNDTYDLQDAEIGISCSTLTKFVFDLEVSHTPSYTNDGGGTTKTLLLEVNWFGDGTDSPYQQTFGSTGQFKGPSYDYADGFFGSIDLSYKRSFSEKYDGRTFSKDIEVGIGFNLAVYQATSGAAWTVDVGAMGYFDADRVSGDIDCDFEASPSVDFTCSGKIRVNPSWAGVYHHDWNNL